MSFPRQPPLLTVALALVAVIRCENDNPPVGAGTLADISREIWPLVAFFTATMVAAILRFRKRLD